MGINWEYREFGLPNGPRDRASIAGELNAGWELIGVRPTNHGGRVRHNAVMRRRIEVAPESHLVKAGEPALSAV